ncbi:dioxygenase [Microbacterium binotii]|uniref:dioxygenase n=1 Tax=Microbacterium binotii TaxID=462710 RepID=UPI001F43A922|nr:dioxygenase [Microbacterium binotii]UIN29269.1 dioxygenase [Microbacterium binotii]
MAAGNKQQRAERERARLYQARRAHHDAQITRRRRDNILAGLGGGVLVLAVLGGQIAYYTVGPGVSSPVVETPSPAPSDPAPTSTPLPTPEPTS